MPSICEPARALSSSSFVKRMMFDDMLSNHPASLASSTLSGLMLASKENGGHHWVFPIGRDTGTIAVDYMAVECNSVSPHNSPKLSDKAGKQTVRKWRAHSVPTMVPRKEHKTSFDTNIIPQPLLSSTNSEPVHLTDIPKYHPETNDQLNSPSPSQLTSFLTLSHNYKYVHRRTVSLPIEPLNSNYPNILHKVLELPPIKLLGGSFDEEPLLTEELAEQISRFLPRRLRLNRNWKLLFSLEQHGCTLSTLFQVTRNKGPSVLIIRDSCGSIFGAFITEHFRPSPTYYGGGECFLWKVSHDGGKIPKIKIYNRTGENEYFMLSENHFIAVGGGNGTFGLWLDNHLDRGFTTKCSTFGNEVLSASSVFNCVELEIWSCT
ncbi:oxidation resistance protein 1 [Basidiobolus ranarum]|uniref:Oxidation resistance protein 1 n=1 Tax=Basidiobolus ranarum TaxID=34480 RepID=A0ABR2WPL5_9FUNG